MNMVHLVEWEPQRETEVLGEDLSVCHFIHLKSHDLVWNWTQAAVVGIIKILFCADTEKQHDGCKAPLEESLNILSTLLYS
jgi:hypothetical protein